MIKYSGKCGDCIYSKPDRRAGASKERECSWNHRTHAADHECHMHSFFPKKQETKSEVKNEKIQNDI